MTNSKWNGKGAPWRKTALSLLLSLSLLPVMPAAASQAEDRMKEVLQLLSRHHVSGVQEETLSDTAIQAMIKSLQDPYTEYMTKDQWQRFMNSIERSYVGIGIQVGSGTGGIYVERVYPGTPAEAAGLQRGDLIQAVNGTDLLGKTTEQVVQLILGVENTELTLSYIRDGQEVSKKLLRQPISLPVLETSYWDGGVGYMKLTSFSDQADEQFRKKLAELKRKPDFSGLVLDLRDNSGGLLETALYIAAEFVEQGTLMQTRDRTGKNVPIQYTGGTKVHVPVYVLVNENSASASEVLAGFLQDYGAAVVTGVTTYGKGSVQQSYSLSDGSRLKITVEEYLTPKGRQVNQKGITPDIVLEGEWNQLLSTMGKAGVKSFRVHKERSYVEVNGTPVNEHLPVVDSEDGRVWIHSRFLAALVGAQIQWKADQKAVELTGVSGGGSGKQTFSLASGNAQMIEGRVFIEAKAFTKLYPQLTIEGHAEKLELRIGAGK